MTDNTFLQVMQEVSNEVSSGKPVDSNEAVEPSVEDGQQKEPFHPYRVVDAIEDVAGETVAAPFKAFQDAADSAGYGVAEAMFETKDFLVGEPEEDQKSAFRKGIESERDRLDQDSTVNALSSGISQFATGILGAGKLMAPLKIAQRGKKARIAGEVVKGAAAGAVVIDPHEDRLSNLIEQYPELSNPVTSFLAADPSDSAAEGRFKNALEGIGMDLAIVGTFTMAAKGLRSLRVINSPDSTPSSTKKAKQEIESLQKEPGQKPDEKIEQVPPVGSDGPKPKKKKPKVNASESDIGDIIQGARDDLKALERYGSREAALTDGYKFSGSSKLPWQKLRDSDGVNSLVSNTAARLKGDLDKIKGGDVLTDVRVRQMVGQRAALFNEDPDLLIGKIVESGEGAKRAVADMEAAYLISSKMFQDTYDTATKIRHGLLDEWGGDLEVATNELRARIQASAEMYGNARSISSASGRALRRMRGEFRIKPEDIEKISSLDGDKLADILYSTKGDPKKVAEAMSPSFLRRALDEANFSLTNSLLWMYPTHVVNMASNLYMLGARPSEKILGSLILGSAGSPIRKQALKEYRYTVTALSEGWTNAVEAFKRGDSVINPHSSEFFENPGGIDQQVLPWRKVESISDIAANAYASFNYRNVVGLPTRTLGAMDELVKTMRYRAVVQARAAVEAETKGLSGQDLKDHVEKYMSGSFDEAGRGIDPAALKEAQTSTFTQELIPGTIGAGVRNFRATNPEVTFILPFVKTPINVLRYATKMTPGLNLAQQEYRQMISGALGKEAQAQAVGQMSMGSLFMGIAASLALEGRITGAGPTDFHLKKEMMNTGWKPYSFVLDNEDGTKTYVPIGRFDPVGMPFGMIADLVEMQITHPNTKQAEGGMAAVAIALAQNFSEKTFLLNLNQVIRAMSEPGKSGEKFIGNTLGNTIPLSSLLRGGNPDPYLRDARGIVDNAMKNMPGYSETLDPQRDVFGEPLWRRVGLTSTQDTDIVQAEHNRIIMETGQGIGKMSATRDGVDLRDIKLEGGRSAYDKLQELVIKPTKGSPTLKRSLEKLIRSKGYATLVDGDSGTRGTRLNAFSSVVSKYRRAAYQRLLKDYPEVRKQVTQRKLDVRTALQTRKTSQEDAARELFDALGIQ
ncbi:MAG: hypothetical protein JJ891_06840 [Rhizobiaceae bacterium]|nr:hypothetical protein [Rhizobiaceae bacterium]